MEKVIKRLIISVALLFLFNNVKSMFFFQSSPETQEKKQILVILEDAKKALLILNTETPFSLAEIKQCINANSILEKTKTRLRYPYLKCFH